MSVQVDDLTQADHAAWRRLWIANNVGHCNEAVTQETWDRLLNPLYPVHGLAARLDGKLVGLVHYILHPVTGHLNSVCYMQDLFVDPPCRRCGVASALVQHLAALARREKWGRLYWLAEANNRGAQSFYDKIGARLNFSVHIVPL